MLCILWIQKGHCRVHNRLPSSGSSLEAYRCVQVTVSVRSTIVPTVRRCVPMPRALLKTSIQNTRRVQRSAYCAENMWRFRMLLSRSACTARGLLECVSHQFSSEAYVSFPRLGIAFATVNVLVLDSSASLNIGKQLILYHRYFCSLPAHLPPRPPFPHPQTFHYPGMVAGCAAGTRLLCGEPS